ncbi:MAG: hypothetical protein ACTHNS_16155 [Marmoricola sp.]
MHDDLDDLLAAAARPVARRTPEVDRAVSEMVARSEELACRPRRRWLRWAGAGIAGLLIIGGGVTAGASNLIPTPTYGHTWGDGPATLHETRTLPSGATCKVQYEVVPLEATLGVGARQWQATIDASHEFLMHFDLASIDLQEALARQRAARDRRGGATGVTNEDGAPPSADSDVLGAMTSEIYRRLSRHLRGLGLPYRSVTMGTGTTCDRRIE